MIVAGVMSGTSADGIDVAIVNINGSGRGYSFDLRLLAHHHLAYPRAVRQAVLAAMNAKSISVAELSRLNFLLGELYADAVRAAQRKSRIKRIDLVGCHGQTIYHQGTPANYLGRKISCTWQTGEGAMIAQKLGVPVVSDFRPADMAVGGKGAPLVPLLDYALFRTRGRGRIVQNIGGIANLTAIPAGAKPEQVLAFDTGPGNMVIDQLMQMLYGQPYDREGKAARSGKILQPVLKGLLRNPFFNQRPPKTAGREEFGREYVARLRKLCARAPKQDVMATATALTAQSIARTIEKFVLPCGRFHEVVVSGGGTKNPTLMGMLRAQLPTLKLSLKYSDDLGVPSQAKEAVAFALLAYQTWRRQPGSIPSATGASRAVVLGKISYA